MALRTGPSGAVIDEGEGNVGNPPKNARWFAERVAEFAALTGRSEGEIQAEYLNLPATTLQGDINSAKWQAAGGTAGSPAPAAGPSPALGGGPAPGPGPAPQPAVDPTAAARAGLLAGDQPLRGAAIQEAVQGSGISGGSFIGRYLQSVLAQLDPLLQWSTALGTSLGRPAPNYLQMLMNALGGEFPASTGWDRAALGSAAAGQGPPGLIAALNRPDLIGEEGQWVLGVMNALGPMGAVTSPFGRHLMEQFAPEFRQFQSDIALGRRKPTTGAGAGFLDYALNQWGGIPSASAVG